MLEYYQGMKCIPMRDLVEHGIMTKANYTQMAYRGKLTVVRQGKGKGNYALVAVDSLLDKYRDKVSILFPDDDVMKVAEWLRKNYERDQVAVVFFFHLANSRINLNDNSCEELIVNASVLNACLKLRKRAETAQKLMGSKYHWVKIAKAVDMLRPVFGHTLPGSPARLSAKLISYHKDGYGALISKKYGNKNALKH